MKVYRLKRVYLILFLFACLTYFLAGCKSTERHRKQADQAADEIIKEKQASALGRTEAFTIEKPSDTLRRRLLIDQNLPYSGNASLGLMYLEPIEHWPEDSYLDPSKKDRAKISTAPWQGEKTLTLSLIDALQIGARNSREYQDQKEEVFRAALNLDLKRNEFQSIFSASAESEVSADLKDGDATVGAENSATGSLTRKLKSGLTVAARIGLDLVSLLTGDRSSSLGLSADATISIPLLRGSGKHIVTEPLTQAERDVVYSIYRFERYKNTFAVQIAADYLEVLKLQDRIRNAEENYRSLITSSRRARRLSDAGRISEIQVDQAKQEELRARERWISAGESYKRRLDSFKMLLGLPTDAIISLDREELLNLSTIKGELLGGSADYNEDSTEEEAPAERTSGYNEATSGEAIQAGDSVDQYEDSSGEVTPVESASGHDKNSPGEATPVNASVELIPPGRENAGPMEIEESAAVKLALEQRLDLRIATGQVYDNQRNVVVAADALRAELTLLGTANVGEGRSLSSAGSPGTLTRPDRGLYTALLSFDFALERTAERIAYRNSLIEMEKSIRAVQAMEDSIKLDVRNRLRDLLESREKLRIQVQAEELARKRVKSANLYLQAGLAEIRDLLEAQEALISAQNAVTSALVAYRVAELELQRDMGVLEVNEEGIWREYVPGE